MSTVLQHYNHLHQIPELGFQEHQTAAYIANELEKAGYKVTRNINNTTGIVAEYDSGKPGPVLTLRADMDALGHIIDGEHCARHTCGHDGHSSILLTAAEELIKEGNIKQGRLKLIFQPAEELGSGALAMIAGGAIDDVDMIIGLHLRPKDECPKGFASPAMFYSASTTVEVNIHGIPAHGARPHLGVNALDAAMMAIQAVNTIHLAPSLTYSVKATRCICDAGVTNAIPSKAYVCWDLRAPTNPAMDELKAKTLQAIKLSVEAIGAKADIEVSKEIPAAEIDNEVSQIITEAIVDVLGSEGLKDPIFTPGGEDFFNYPRERNVKAGFWGLGCDLTPGLHHPEMKFDLSALENGVKITKACALKVLG
ncbi:M20 peptidase aminoacylase family protein [Gilliamella sp. ESL0405]|uniref:M20 peptidase aminoacylase family protein n=1 Tax=Gilliamella sp. ESL0405 TaxID=2704653 RepID=UPI001C6A5D0A|nr:M20 peptidase aminoacylase family protein [Gilliamella sp. ESL0405]QYN46595.1 amidohydrolase [Gilliamella sp. ESL0405]